MGQVLHGSATTTEAVRRAIQHSQESLRALAKRMDAGAAQSETILKAAAGKLRQFKLFYDTECAIRVGVVLFAKVSPAVAARLDAGGRLASLDDWRSGETVRVMTTVAPFGGEVRL
jgi:hemolysin-activating ACP:hemolysin acyltransferase